MKWHSTHTQRENHQHTPSYWYAIRSCMCTIDYSSPKVLQFTHSLTHSTYIENVFDSYVFESYSNGWNTSALTGALCVRASVVVFYIENTLSLYTIETNILVTCQSIQLRLHFQCTHKLFESAAINVSVLLITSAWFMDVNGR